jgi:ubiquinone/menaquinone biosynthesis C-methylase UbiE
MATIELSPQEQLTISEYNKVAHLWAPAHDTQEFWTPEFETFEKLVPQNSNVIEFGSGGGRDARRLAKRYRYLGTDLSSGLMQEARKKNPGFCFREENLYHMSQIADAFHGFWCSATLLHLPKDRVGDALKEMRRVTKPEGVGFISMKEGMGESIDEEKLNGIPFERFFAYYHQDEFTDRLSASGFRIIEQYQKPVGQTNWLIYFIQKP